MYLKQFQTKIFAVLYNTHFFVSKNIPLNIQKFRTRRTSWKLNELLCTRRVCLVFIQSGHTCARSTSSQHIYSFSTHTDDEAFVRLSFWIHFCLSASVSNFMECLVTTLEFLITYFIHSSAYVTHIIQMPGIVLWKFCQLRWQEYTSPHSPCVWVRAPWLVC